MTGPRGGTARRASVGRQSQTPKRGGGGYGPRPIEILAADRGEMHAPRARAPPGPRSGQESRDGRTTPAAALPVAVATLTLRGWRGRPFGGAGGRAPDPADADAATLP